MNAVSETRFVIISNMQIRRRMMGGYSILTKIQSQEERPKVQFIAQIATPIADFFRWYTSDDCVGLDVSRDDRSGRNDGTLSNVYPGHNQCSIANPNPISDSDISADIFEKGRLRVMAESKN